MIKITDLEKIYRTEEVEHSCTEQIVHRSKGRRICSRDGTIRLRQIYFIEYSWPAG